MRIDWEIDWSSSFKNHVKGVIWMKRVMVLEVTGASDDEIQAGLGKAFDDFCKQYKGTGITASVLKEEASEKVKSFINEEVN